MTGAERSRRKMVTIRMTVAQAEALSQAADNSLGCYEDAIAILLDRDAVGRAYRASEILDKAIREVSK